MDNFTFSDILKGLLESRGVSQKWLSVEAETTEATISRYVSGNNQPEILIVMRVAKALDVSVDYLCGLTDIPQSKEVLGDELNMLIKYYSRADKRDKEVVWTVLSRYLTEEELATLPEIEAQREGKRGA